MLDKQRISEGQTIRFEIRIPNTRYHPDGYHRGKGRSSNRRRRGHNLEATNDVKQDYSSLRMNSSAPPPPLGPMKITICWYDPPAPLGSSRSLLMHDLDLMVMSPDGSLHWGNANRGQDFHSSSDVSAEAQRMTGDPFGSNSSYPGWAWADDTNPNEQILIENPQCSASSIEQYCVYTAYVHADYLPLHSYQNYAVVITSPGTVSDPIISDKWFHNIVPDGANHAPLPPKIHSFMAGLVTIDGGLAGGELVSTTTSFTACAAATLMYLEVELQYTNVPGSHASPNYLELTVGGNVN